jgi:hypothetical protein
VLELRNGTRKNEKQFTHSSKPAQNQQTSWLAQGWSTFGARKSHGRPWTYKTHHGLDSREATTFPHIVYSAPLRGSGVRMVFFYWDSQMGVPKSPRLEVPQLCGITTSCADLQLGWGLNQSCSPCRELSKPTHKGIGSIPDFSWLGVKLPV